MRLTSDEDIIRYIKATNDRYDGALCMSLHTPLDKMSTEDRIEMMESGNKDFMLLQAGAIMTQKHGCSLYQGFQHMQTEYGMELHKNIVEYGEVFINPVGGKTSSIKYDQFVWRGALVFPQYTSNDIRIKQFYGGTHYYAYVGDTQLRDGDNIKWNSKLEAYELACKLVANA